MLRKDRDTHVPLFPTWPLRQKNPMSRPPLRRQWYVDSNVQRDLILRFVYYWAASMLFLTLPIALVSCVLNPTLSFLTHATNVFLIHWPVLITLSMMVPFLVNDITKFSNRFAGPVFRLRRELERFAQTGEMAEIQFREGDFWPDLAEGINHLSARVKELERQLAEARGDTAAASTANVSVDPNPTGK